MSEGGLENIPRMDLATHLIVRDSTAKPSS
jgi:hypothetical protein